MRSSGSSTTAAAPKDCYAGPCIAIGEDCRLEHAEVEHSIVLAGASVCDLAGRMMESSLRGRNVRIGRDHHQPRAVRFLVGDNSEIESL